MRYKLRNQLLEDYGFGINSHSPEPFFEYTLKLAASICNTPVAYISIIGDKKQYIINQHGSNFQTIDKEESICQHTIQKRDLLVIKDTSEDNRTKFLSLTKGENRVGFYAGFPLIDEDLNSLGALCVTDHNAGNLDEDQQKNLEILGKQVVAFLNVRKKTIAALNDQGVKPIEKPNTVIRLIQKLNNSSNQLNSSNSKLRLDLEDFQSKNRELSTLMDEFPGTVSVLNREFRYTYNNKKYEELSDHSHHDIVGMHVRDIVGQEVFENLKPLYDRVLNGEKVSLERFIDFKNGKRFLSVNYCPAYNNDDKIVGIYVFSKDLTDIKSYQSQLENSNENLENFAHMVCHDLQSPLRTITSFGALLERDLKKNNVEYKNEYLDFITQSAKQSSKLVSDLLQFAKVGNEESVMQEVSVADVCDSVLLNLFAQIQKENANVVLPENDLMLFGFRTDFVILFQNFISNAIKYRNPELSPKILVQTSEKEHGIEIAISDNGLGIPKDKIAKIFEPFTRLKEYSHIEGTGIGLATCRKILEKYNSTIKVESTYGEGSRFSFLVPQSDYLLEKVQE